MLTCVFIAVPCFVFWQYGIVSVALPPGGLGVHLAEKIKRAALLDVHSVLLHVVDRHSRACGFSGTLNMITAVDSAGKRGGIDPLLFHNYST